jgi:5-methylthioadenosine/S-adenosylhomocysteine deaminase
VKILIKNAFAILPEGCETDVSVCIADGEIVSVRTVPEGFTPDRVIDAADRLLVPGFVNAHTHVHMTALRNRADDLSFMTWLFDKVVPMEDKLTTEDAYWSCQLAFMEMLESGITSFMDMHMFPDTMARTTLDAGFRAVLTRGLQGGEDDPENDERRIRESKQDIERYAGAPTLGFMLAPHAPYTCGERYLRRIAELAGELDVGVHTHLSESLDEQDRIRARCGKSPAEYYDACGILRENTVCAHCVYLSESDMALLAARGTSVAHNAASNMKLGNGFADVPAMLAHGINVCLGTDSAASNNNLSLLREMQLAALIHKGTHGDAAVLNARTVFDMATVNGAKALGLAGKVGQVRAGMRADLSLFPLDSPGFFPIGEPKAALCYSSAGLKAETVLIDGRILLDKGEFKTIDSERVMREIRALVKRF